jgi:ketosteroid isomerase-like protein
MKTRITLPVIFIILITNAVLIAQDATSLDNENQQLTRQEKENKKTVQRLVQALNEKTESVFDELISADYVQHQNGISDPTTGPDVIKSTLEWDSETFTENHYAVEDIILHENKVVVRMILHGTTKNNSEVSNHSILIMRFKDGKVVEGWITNDRLTLQRQLSPQQASPQFQQQDAMKKVMAQMAESVMEATLTIMSKSQTTEQLATFSKRYYDALIAKGFSKDDALKLVISVGMPTIPSMK